MTQNTPGMNARRLYTPHPQFTGRCQFQPRAEDTHSGWRIDWRGNYNEAGFLDAPDRLASGSVRGIEIAGMCLMVADVPRHGEQP